MAIPGLNIQIIKQVIELRRDRRSYSQIQQSLHLTRGQVAGILFRAREQAKNEAADRAIAQALAETNYEYAKKAS